MLLPCASALPAVDDTMADSLSADIIAGIVNSVPEGWLREAAGSEPPVVRAAYARYLVDRLEAPRDFVA